jgi:hypothetical protein
LVKGWKEMNQETNVSFILAVYAYWYMELSYFLSRKALGYKSPWASSMKILGFRSTKVGQDHSKVFFSGRQIRKNGLKS